MKNWPLMYLRAKPPKLEKVYVSLFEHVGHRRRAEQNILDLIKDDARRLIYTEEANEDGKEGDEEHNLVVREREKKSIVVLDADRAITLRLASSGGGFLREWRR